MSLDWATIHVEPRGLQNTPCDCCGKTTVKVDGDLYQQDSWIGFYTVLYCDGHPEADPIFSVGTGDWTDKAAPDQRWVVTTEFNREADGFRAIDPPSKTDNAIYLDRDDWIGSDFAADAFAMLDAVIMKDDRIKDLRQ